MDRGGDGLLVTYYVEGKPNERHRTCDTELGGQERAIGIRGNVYSYMLPWESILSSAEKVTSDDVFEVWPHPPKVVAHMFRFALSARLMNNAWLA